MEEIFRWRPLIKTSPANVDNFLLYIVSSKIKSVEPPKNSWKGLISLLNSIFNYFEMSRSPPNTMTRWNLFLYFSINLQMNVDFPDPLNLDTNKRAGLLKMFSTSSVARPYDWTTKKGLNQNKVNRTLI